MLCVTIVIAEIVLWLSLNLDLIQSELKEMPSVAYLAKSWGFFLDKKIWRLVCNFISITSFLWWSDIHQLPNTRKYACCDRKIESMC